MYLILQVVGIEDEAGREEEEVRIKERSSRSEREDGACGDVKLLSGRFLGLRSLVCWFAGWLAAW
jgi:hypothetical protein